MSGLIRNLATGEPGTGAPTRLQIGVLLGGEENSTKKQMQDVVDFETKLAQIMTPLEERRDEEKLYNLMSLSELQRKAPFVSDTFNALRIIVRLELIAFARFSV